MTEMSVSNTTMTERERDSGRGEIVRSLVKLGLWVESAAPIMVPLTGGVSSDIWRVDLPSRRVCVKRALSRLRVDAVWEAPVRRNDYEVAWMNIAARIAPGSVPAMIAHDSEAGLFVMEFVDFPLWKEQLRSGLVEPRFAEQVGTLLGTLHAGTAKSNAIAQQFANDEIFYAIRLEPYLVATAKVHRDCASQLAALVEVTRNTKLALVHGDVSPKNILAGSRGPVLLDAECAWYGDPAFDLAFCLNHLLLKCIWVPGHTAALHDSFAALAAAYLRAVNWEPAATIEARTARLLPALFLARIDGKSPIEYITEECDKNKVRRVARQLLLHPVHALSEVSTAWREELAR
jgi:aminoglycoside phosphotransferase (APT) family kinase protein